MDLNKCGEGELDVSIISASGDPVESDVRLLDAGRLEVVHSPEEGGIHFAEVMFNGEPVPGTPCVVIFIKSYEKVHKKTIFTSAQ